MHRDWGVLEICAGQDRKIASSAVRCMVEWSPSRYDEDLRPLDGAKGKLGIADLKEGYHAAKEAFG